MSRQRVTRRSVVQWPLRDDADRHEDLVRSLTQPCLDLGPLDEDLELELERSLMDPGNEPGPLLQEMLPSLLDPRNDHEALVASYSRIRLVNLFCAPCASFIGWVASWEVGDRLPGHLPYCILTRQIPDPATEAEGDAWPGGVPAVPCAPR